MSELVDELRKVQLLGGDTYSSAEVIGLVGRSADEIERLRTALRWGDDRAYREGRLVMDSKQDLVDEIERLRAALDQALDDMGDSHCVCQATKEMMQTVIDRSAHRR